MLSFRNPRFRYDPYPMGVVTPCFDPEQYRALSERFPSEDMFVHMRGAYNKYSLSERNNPKAYAKAVAADTVWQEFYWYVKSEVFIADVLGVLANNGISLHRPGPYTSRFEFSSLPAKGGHLDPHTDIPSKVATLIVPMVQGSWDLAWGGGTDMLRPCRTDVVYTDYKVPREAFDLVESMPYAPNHCTIFVKTDNSWHAVGPIQGPENVMRRTLTINIETA